MYTQHWLASELKGNTLNHSLTFVQANTIGQVWWCCHHFTRLFASDIDATLNTNEVRAPRLAETCTGCTDLRYQIETVCRSLQWNLCTVFKLEFENCATF